MTIDVSSDNIYDGVTIHLVNGYKEDVKVTNAWASNVMTVLLTDTEDNTYGATFDWSNFPGANYILRGGTILQGTEQTATVSFKDLPEGKTAKSITIDSVCILGSKNTITINNAV